MHGSYVAQKGNQHGKKINPWWKQCWGDGRQSSSCSLVRRP